jgi:hypothetical protein
MSIDRPRNLEEEGQRLARKLLASRNSLDVLDGIIVDRLVLELEKTSGEADRFEMLNQAAVVQAQALQGDLKRVEAALVAIRAQRERLIDTARRHLADGNDARAEVTKLEKWRGEVTSALADPDVGLFYDDVAQAARNLKVSLQAVEQERDAALRRAKAAEAAIVNRVFVDAAQEKTTIRFVNKDGTEAARIVNLAPPDEEKP